MTEVKESLFLCFILTQPPPKSASCLGAITKQATKAERPEAKCVLLVGPVQDQGTPAGHPGVPQLSSQWIFSPAWLEAWLCFSPVVEKSTPRSEEHSWGLDQVQCSGGTWGSNCPYISNTQHGLYAACKAFTITLVLLSPKLYICHSPTSVIAPHSFTNAFLSPGCNYHQRERPFLAHVPILPCLSRYKVRRQEILP